MSEYFCIHLCFILAADQHDLVISHFKALSTEVSPGRIHIWGRRGDHEFAQGLKY